MPDLSPPTLRSAHPVQLHSSAAVARVFFLLLGGRFGDGLHLSSVIAQQTNKAFLAKFLHDLVEDLSAREEDYISHEMIASYFFQLGGLDSDFTLSVLFDLISLKNADHVSFCLGIFSRLKDIFASDSVYYLRLSALFASRSDLGCALEFLDRVADSDRDVDFWVQYGQWVFLHSYDFTDLARDRLILRSLSCFDRALSLRPNDALILTLLGIIEKKRGNMARGWSLYENRHRLPTRSLTKPLWDGGGFSGRTLLLHHEGGFGDAIQFSRYLHDLYALSQDGGRVIFSVKAGLERLFRQCFALGGIEVHVGDVASVGHDYILPLFSIFDKLDPDLSRMGIDRPYISAPARPIAGFKGCKKIGLVWASTAGTSAGKTIPQDMLSRLGLAKGVHFYSLQYEEELNLAVRSDPELSFIDMSLRPELMDFYDLACAISGLDGVISVDTATAHLAGSMFCPLLVLVPHHDRCWRWNEETYREDWYPSAIRMCQDISGDWGAVLDRVVENLNSDAFPGDLSLLRIPYS